jgi:hypothetical protein
MSLDSSCGTPRQGTIRPVFAGMQLWNPAGQGPPVHWHYTPYVYIATIVNARKQGAKFFPETMPSFFPIQAA